MNKKTTKNSKIVAKKAVKPAAKKESKIVKNTTTKFPKKGSKILNFFKKVLCAIKDRFFLIIVTLYGVIRDIIKETIKFIKAILKIIYKPFKKPIHRMLKVQIIFQIVHFINFIFKLALAKTTGFLILVPYFLWKKLSLKGFSKKVRILALIIFTTIVIILGYFYIQNMKKEPVVLNVNSYNNTVIINFKKDIADMSANTFYEDTNAFPLKAEYEGKNIFNKVKTEDGIFQNNMIASGSSISISFANKVIPGQEYKITLDKDLFQKTYRFKSYTVKVETPKFSASINELKLYQDPLKKKSFKVIGTFYFNNGPVSIQDLLENVKISSKYNSNIKVDFNLDANKEVAYFKTEDLPIKSKNYDIKVEITKNMKTTLGDVKIDKSVDQSINIPDSGSFFQVADSQSSIVKIKEKNDRPEQIFSVEFTSGVKSSDLAKNMTVYLLPTEYVATKHREKKKDYSKDYWELSEINDDVLAHSQILDYTTMPTGLEYDTIHTFQYNIKDKKRRFLFVKISNNLKSKDDFQFKKDYKNVLQVSAFEKEIKVANDGIFLSFKGEGNLPVLTRGVSKIKVDIFKVKNEQIQHIVSQTSDYSNAKNPTFIDSYEFDESNISDEYKKEITIENPDPQLESYTAINLKDYIKWDSGIFFVKITDKDKNVSTNRFVVLSDIGLFVKKNADNSRDVFAFSQKDASAVKDAKISFLKKNGTLVYTQTTDRDGHVKFPSISNISDYVAIIAEKDGDKMFLPTQKWDIADDVNYSKYDISGEYRDTSSDSLNAFLFSDRGIYRPGETVKIGSIVRKMNYGDLKGLPLQLQIKDASDNTVLTKKFTVDKDSGINDFEYQIADTASTGTWSVEMYIEKTNSNNTKYLSFLSKTNIRVEEFKPDTMKITSSIKLSGEAPTPVGWLPMTNLSASVVLTNLFGTPAQNRTIKSTLNLYPTDFKFAKYSDFSFADPYKSSSVNIYNVSKNLDEQTSDDDGKANFDIDLSSYNKGTYRLNLNTSGYEEDGGKSVSATSSILVSPAENIIGFRGDRDLTFLKKDVKAKIEFIAINNNLDKVKKDGLNIKIIKYENVNTLVKNDQDLYVYDNIQKEKIISKTKFSISKDGQFVNLNTKEVGDFAIEISDDNDVVWSIVPYSILGATDSQTMGAKDTNLILKLDKNNYKNGEDIQIGINSPYKGSGLITIEKDKVYSYKWFTMDGTTSLQTITVPNTLDGNAYVNVSLVRSKDSNEIFLSPHSYAIAPININSEKRKIKINLGVPETIKPGEEFQVKYSTDKPSDIILFGVDSGILQVANYQAPDAYKFFFKKTALGVATQETFDFLIPEYKIFKMLSSSGAGYADDEADMKIGLRAENLNPFKRKSRAPATFWSGILSADSTTKTANFKLPADFNGEVKIMAVAANDQATGYASTKLISKAPIVMTSNIPTTISENDKFTISVNVSNINDKNPSESNIELLVKTTDNLKLLDKDVQKIQVKYGSEKALKLSFSGNGKLGEGKITIIANFAKSDEKTTYSDTVSIRPVAPRKNILIAGFKTKKSFSLDLPQRDFYNDLSEQKISFSSNPFILANGIKSFLDNYSNLCSEQIISKILPYIYMSESDKTDLKIDKAALIKSFGDVQNILAKRQLVSGGIGLWDSPGEENIFATIYAYQLLTAAKETGEYGISKELAWNLETRLTKFVKTDSGDDLSDETLISEFRMKTYAMYLLTKNGHLVTNDLIALENNLQQVITSKKITQDDADADITTLFLAAINSQIKADDKAQKYLKAFLKNRKYYKQADDDYDYLSLGDKYLQNAIATYILASDFKSEQYKPGNDELKSLLSPMISGSYNSLYASYATMALSALKKLYKENNNLISLKTEYFDSKKTLNTAPAAEQNMNLTNSESKFDITATSDESPVFYVAQMSGFNKIFSDTNAENGIDIEKTITDKDGKEVTSVKIGDELNVNIFVKTNGSSKYLNGISVIDLIPGGTQIISEPTVDNNADNSVDDEGSASDDIQNQQAREDRMLYYVSLTDQGISLKYKIKALEEGEFKIPPAYAQDMYNENNFGLQTQKTLKIVGKD